VHTGVSELSRDVFTVNIFTFAAAWRAQKVCDARRLCVRRAATARRISLGGEGNAAALYPVLCSYLILIIFVS